jgi:hypothetical protein
MPYRRVIERSECCRNAWSMAARISSFEEAQSARTHHYSARSLPSVSSAATPRFPHPRLQPSWQRGSQSGRAPKRGDFATLTRPLDSYLRDQVPDCIRIRYTDGDPRTK